ncbi:MAG TPA: mechanosensitive ion channel domain-containing protein [Steroidobacteraceae bacterium]|nr:mechanosensitive ion channel domain-containing protein [Steroidobacteraceae bacterium]
MSHLLSLPGDLGSWVRPNTLTGAVAYLVLFCGLAALVSRALRIAIQTAISHVPVEHVDRTAANFLRQLGVLLIWVVFLALYAHLIPDLRALGTAMLAGAGVASIVLGLAAQGTLGNLVAGISILIYRPFRLGDVLQISAPTGPEIGTVEALSLGYTILGTRDGRRVIVPNSLAISQIAINLNAFAPQPGPVINFWVARSDLAHARTVAIGLAHALGAQSVACFVVKSETSALQLALSMRLAQPEVFAGLADRLLQALESEGIATPSGKDHPTLAAS